MFNKFVLVFYFDRYLLIICKDDFFFNFIIRLCSIEIIFMYYKDIKLNIDIKKI